MKKSKFILGVLTLFFIVGFSKENKTQHVVLPPGVEIVIQYHKQYSEQQKTAIREAFRAQLGPIHVTQMSNHSNGNEQEVWTVGFINEQIFQDAYSQVIESLIGTTKNNLTEDDGGLGGRDPRERFKISYTYLGIPGF